MARILRAAGELDTSQNYTPWMKSERAGLFGPNFRVSLAAALIEWIESIGHFGLDNSISVSDFSVFARFF